MKKRRTADEVTRLLREADRDLAKGLTVSGACRKIGIAETTYYRWRERHDPAVVDADRRCRELESEVERLKRLVAEPIGSACSRHRNPRRALALSELLILTAVMARDSRAGH